MRIRHRRPYTHCSGLCRDLLHLAGATVVPNTQKGRLSLGDRWCDGSHKDFTLPRIWLAAHQCESHALLESRWPPDRHKGRPNVATQGIELDDFSIQSELPPNPRCEVCSESVDFDVGGSLQEIFLFATRLRNKQSANG